MKKQISKIHKWWNEGGDVLGKDENGEVMYSVSLKDTFYMIAGCVIALAIGTGVLTALVVVVCHYARG